MVLFMLIMVFITGCVNTNPENIKYFSKPDKVQITADNYILQPPDEIEVVCSKATEINFSIQRIRPDGKVAFESLGEVEAAGRTPKQLADILADKIAELYKLPGENPVEVKVMAYRSKFYYVFGQVSYPGAQPYTGRDSVLHAISEARPNIMAWKEKIRVIRPSDKEDIDPKIFKVNWDKMSSKGYTSKNVLLQEGDIIYVPPTVLAWISMRVEEALRPIGRIFSTVNIGQRATAGGSGVGQ
jgi:polysaccharide export outer membrane protein